MIANLGWFVAGAVCGGAAVALLGLMTSAATGMPGNRRRWGRPQ